MAKQRVVISGGGIAGAVIAYWLGKHDYEVVVLERSKSQTQAGQIIDVEGPAQEIVSQMGLLSKIKSNVTQEAGISLVDSASRIIGTFPVAQALGVSNEIEIMRPALAQILLEAAESFENVEFRFGSTISQVEQTGTQVLIEINNKEHDVVTKEAFDFLIVCDGLRSKTRDLVLPASERTNCVKSLNAFVAFFNVPAKPQDRPYSRFYHATGRRSGLIKPLTDKQSSAYLNYVKYDQELHDARESRDVQRQKKAIAARFSSTGWEDDRFVQGMLEAENFYFEELSQVKLDKWSRGRCVFLGDTAYCPSPLTGQGTNLAILGAYVLADKIVKNRDNVEQAFEEYEKDLRPYVNKVQPIPLGGLAPLVGNPDSAWGIWILRTIVSWVCWLQLYKYIPDLKNEPFELPDF